MRNRAAALLVVELEDAGEKVRATVLSEMDVEGLRALAQGFAAMAVAVETVVGARGGVGATDGPGATGVPQAGPDDPSSGSVDPST